VSLPTRQQGERPKNGSVVYKGDRPTKTDKNRVFQTTLLKKNLSVWSVRSFGFSYSVVQGGGAKSLYALALVSGCKIIDERFLKAYNNISII
jgi:hypothetical protein